jgi:cytoskeleton protein RodZ
MSEGENMSAVVNDGSPALPLPPAQAATAGAWLRQARQAKGLHIAAMSVHLKVPQSKLEALEADRYQDLPDATFARALATAICRLLKIDAAPVLALLPPSDSATLERVSPGLNEPFRERPSQDEALGMDWIKSPVVWAPVLLLLAAVGVYLMPEGWLQLSKPNPAPTAQVPMNSQPIELPASAPALVVTGAPAPTQATDPEPTGAAASLPGTAAPKSLAAPAPVASAQTAAATPAPATSATPPKPAGASALVLRAKAQTWIEITDARGQVQFSRLMQPGEQADLDVALPAQLRIGNVAGTEVMLRGANLDLASRAKDNVARIELN